MFASGFIRFHQISSDFNSCCWTLPVTSSLPKQRSRRWSNWPTRRQAGHPKAQQKKFPLPCPKGFDSNSLPKGNELHSLSQRDLQAIFAKTEKAFAKGKTFHPAACKSQAKICNRDGKSLLLISQLISVLNLRLFLIDFACESLIENLKINILY